MNPALAGIIGFGVLIILLFLLNVFLENSGPLC